MPTALSKVTPFIVSQLLGLNGYRKWSDGTIEQWGLVGAGQGNSVITFPIAFPNTVWTIAATIRGGSTQTGLMECLHLATVNLNNFTGCPRFYLNGNIDIAGEPWSWQARGN